MTVLLPIFFVVALLLFLTALYVGAEFATVSARRSRLKQMALGGNRQARHLLSVVEHRRTLDEYIAACQIGITLAALALGAFGQRAIAPALLPLLARLPGLDRVSAPAALSVTATAALIVLTFLSMVLGELFPKSVATQYPEKVALGVMRPMQWSMALFRPFIWLFNGSANLLLRLAGVRAEGRAARAHTPGEIELLAAESRAGGLLEADEQRMLRNTLRLRELTARQVMTPRMRLTAAPLASPTSDLLALCNRSGHTRLPLFRETIDDVAGFVHVRDLLLLSVEGKEDLAAILRPVSHVPHTLPAAELWARLIARGQQMAVVLDEFGGTEGIVMLEDLIEEIVGELQDEFDAEGALAAPDREGRLRLRADLLVEDVNEFLGLRLPEGRADTLGGLVMGALGRIPEVGEEAAFGPGDVRIRVEEMEALAVVEVSLRLPSSADPRRLDWEMAGGD